MAAIDNYVGIPQKDGPYTSAAAVTPNDGADLTNVTRALNIGSVAGGATLTVVMQDGQTVTFTVSAGLFLPVRVTRVKSTGTLASSIVALW